MTVAYVDTSCLVAVALGERGAAAVARRLRTFDRLISANLLEAELRAAYRREQLDGEAEALGVITWVIPDRPLGDEIRRVLETGYLRGADCWHLAAALYVAEDPATMAFVTLDTAQRRAARVLGFVV